jgi:hypothetical protein
MPIQKIPQHLKVWGKPRFLASPILNNIQKFPCESGLYMRRILSLIGMVGFVSSVVVHGATYFNVNMGKNYPSIWLLHVGAIALCFPMAISTRSLKKGNKKDVWNRFFEPMPAWTRTIAFGFFGYAILNFMLFFFSSAGDPTPVIRNNGEYTIRTTVDGESQFTPISRDEYYERQTKVVRGFSGHWMIFYLLPTLYFWFPRQRPEHNWQQTMSGRDVVEI